MVKGQKLITPAAPLVYEYQMRKQMAGLGYTSDISKLSVFKAECFSLIESTIQETRAKEAKRNGRRK